MSRAVMDALAQDDRGDSMLEDQLFLVVAFKHNGIFIKRADAPGEFDSAQ